MLINFKNVSECVTANPRIKVWTKVRQQHNRNLCKDVCVLDNYVMQKFINYLRRTICYLMQSKICKVNNYTILPKKI